MQFVNRKLSVYEETVNYPGQPPPGVKLVERAWCNGVPYKHVKPLRKRSDGRMKEYPSASELSWSNHEEQRRQHILDVVREEYLKSFSGGKYVSIEALLEFLITDSSATIKKLEQKVKDLQKFIKNHGLVYNEKDPLTLNRRGLTANELALNKQKQPKIVSKEESILTKSKIPEVCHPECGVMMAALRLQDLHAELNKFKAAIYKSENSEDKNQFNMPTEIQCCMSNQGGAARRLIQHVENLTRDLAKLRAHVLKNIQKLEDHIKATSDMQGDSKVQEENKKLTKNLEDLKQQLLGMDAQLQKETKMRQKCETNGYNKCDKHIQEISNLKAEIERLKKKKKLSIDTLQTADIKSDPPSKPLSSSRLPPLTPSSKQVSSPSLPSQLPPLKPLTPVPPLPPSQLFPVKRKPLPTLPQKLPTSSQLPPLKSSSSKAQVPYIKPSQVKPPVPPPPREALAATKPLRSSKLEPPPILEIPSTKKMISLQSELPTSRKPPSTMSPRSLKLEPIPKPKKSSLPQLSSQLETLSAAPKLSSPRPSSSKLAIQFKPLPPLPSEPPSSSRCSKCLSLKLKEENLMKENQKLAKALEILKTENIELKMNASSASRNLNVGQKILKDKINKIQHPSKTEIFKGKNETKIKNKDKNSEITNTIANKSVANEMDFNKLEESMIEKRLINNDLQKVQKPHSKSLEQEIPEKDVKPFKKNNQTAQTDFASAELSRDDHQTMMTEKQEISEDISGQSPLVMINFAAPYEQYQEFCSLSCHTSPDLVIREDVHPIERRASEIPLKIESFQKELLRSWWNYTKQLQTSHCQPVTAKQESGSICYCQNQAKPWEQPICSCVEHCDINKCCCYVDNGDSKKLPIAKKPRSRSRRHRSPSTSIRIRSPEDTSRAVSLSKSENVAATNRKSPPPHKIPHFRTELKYVRKDSNQVKSVPKPEPKLNWVIKKKNFKDRSSSAEVMTD